MEDFHKSKHMYLSCGGNHNNMIATMEDLLLSLTHLTVVTQYITYSRCSCMSTTSIHNACISITGLIVIKPMKFFLTKIHHTSDINVIMYFFFIPSNHSGYLHNYSRSGKITP